MEEKYIESPDKKVMKQELQIVSHLMCPERTACSPANIARVSDLIIIFVFQISGCQTAP